MLWPQKKVGGGGGGEMSAGGGGDFLPFQPPCINHCRQEVLSCQTRGSRSRSEIANQDVEGFKLGGCKVHAREIFGVQTDETQRNCSFGGILST